MRPPLNAGENRAPSGARTAAGSTSFNEAPAERGGKPLARRPLRVDVQASMRPPLNAGENAANAAMRPDPQPGFNEAPAERGGKLRTTPNAGHPLFANASMRPPLNAGENAASR